MKLSKRNNLILFFYRYYVSNRYESTNNLCPLFWGGVLGFFMFLLTLPAFIIITPMTMIEDRRWFDFKNGVNETGGISFWFKVFVQFCLFVLTICGACARFGEIPKGEFWQTICDGVFLNLLCGILITIVLGVGVALLIFICKGINWLFSIIFSTNIPVPKIQAVTITKEFIKAKYNKYCPQIEWEEDEH